jgi:hypothetical protein
LCDIFGVDAPHRTHGHSLAPLVQGERASIREWALAGVWGREVHAIAPHNGGVAKYVRAPAGANAPLSMWSNRWSTMPLHHYPDLRMPVPDDRAVLDRMPGSNIPVIRQPFHADDRLPFWAYTHFVGTLAFDLGDDPAEERNRATDSLGKELADVLREALRTVEAPDDQLVRLGY